MLALDSRIPVMLQRTATECGVACVAMIASFHGLRTDLHSIRQRLTPSLKGTTLRQLGTLAESMNMSVRAIKVGLDDLDKITMPAILHWELNHFVVLVSVSNGKVTIHDPARGRRVLSRSEVSKCFTGVALEFFKAPGFARGDERRPFRIRELISSLSAPKAALVQILILSFVLEILAIASPLFPQLVIDRILVGQDRDLLNVIGIGFVILVFVTITVSAVRARLVNYVSTDLNLQLLDKLFGQLVRLPLTWFESRQIGDIVSRFRSVDAVQRALTLTFLEALIDGLMVIITLLVMFAYSLKLAAIGVVSGCAYWLARQVLYQPQRYATDEKLHKESRAGTHFIETLRGMMAIKLNKRELDRRSTYLNLVVDQNNAEIHVQDLTVVQRSIQAFVFSLETVVVIWVGAHSVLQREMTVGMLVAFLGFQTMFLTRVQALIDKIMEFNMLDLHAERIGDIALAEPERTADVPSIVRSHRQSSQFSIEAKSLGFSYDGGSFIFRNVDFMVRSGETVAIVGPSGCGKTTLVKALAGLIRCSEGSIIAADVGMAHWDLSDYRDHVAVVMQDDHLFWGSIEDNISFFDPMIDLERVRECAKLAMIDAEIDQLPMRYDTIIGSLGTALSGGQKQRILLARALYHNPQILFLDESFDQLDIEREQAIVNELKKSKMGLVIVSHRPDTVRTVDRIIELRSTTS